MQSVRVEETPVVVRARWRAVGSVGNRVEKTGDRNRCRKIGNGAGSTRIESPVDTRDRKYLDRFGLPLGFGYRNWGLGTSANGCHNSDRKEAETVQPSLSDVADKEGQRRVRKTNDSQRSLSCVSPTVSGTDRSSPTGWVDDWRSRDPHVLCPWTRVLPVEIGFPETFRVIGGLVVQGKQLHPSGRDVPTGLLIYSITSFSRTSREVLFGRKVGRQWEGDQGPRGLRV